MLKFLRKYQLFIMIIGGSLLMVIFLLEPVITRLAPTGAGQTVATLGSENTEITARQRDTANSQFAATRAVAPALFAWPATLAILDQQDPTDHWLLLAHEAEKNGLIGEAGDGESWLIDLARLTATAEARASVYQQFGGSNLPPAFIERLLQQRDTADQIEVRTQQLIAEMPRRAEQATGVSFLFKNPDDVYKALATARGITRLVSLHSTAPKASLPEAKTIIATGLDGVAIDYFVLTPDLILPTLNDPTDEELQAHFDRFRELEPAESEFGIGYVLPPRVQLEYLTLDAPAIASSLTLDRVEISKRFRRNPDAFPGDLTAATPLIEAQLRQEATEQILIEADRIIQGIILNSTRDLDKDQSGRIVTVPEGWTSPTLETVALRVQEGVKSALGHDIPLPTVTRRASSWLTAQDIAQLPSLGQARFRVGANTIQTAALATVAVNDEIQELIPFTVGVPHAKDVATDAAGSRHYITLLAARDTSPAESIDEVGRDRVLQDAKQIQAFDLLSTTSISLLDLARGSGLAAIRDQYPESNARPDIQTNAIVRKQAANSERLNDPRLNTDQARQTILDTARERLDPLQAAEDVDPTNAYLAVDLPGSRSVAIVKLIARRPPTDQLALQRGEGLVAQATNQAIGQREDFADLYPFSLEAMKRRFNYQVAGREAQLQAELEPQPASESESESDSANQAAPPAEANVSTGD